MPNDVPSLLSGETATDQQPHGPAYALDGKPVKLGQFQFTIHVEAGLQNDSGQGLMGAHRHSSLQLWLDGNLLQPMVLPVLLHEILHEMYKQTGRQHDEGDIDAIAYFLSQVLSDNSDLFRFISERTQ